MPPVLELTDEMVGPKRTEMSLAYLKGLMQWPDNPAERRNVMRAAHVLQMRETLRTVPASREALALDVVDAALALEKTPVAIRKDGEGRYLRGCMVGELVLAAAVVGPELKRIGHEGPVQIESYKRELTSDAARARHPALNVTQSSLDNTILPLFRPVGHLWAAHIQEIKFYSPDFPCTLDRLQWFLWAAEAIRQRAIAIKQPRRRSHRHNTLLSADEAWVLPDGLVLGEAEYVAGTPNEVEVPVWPVPRSL